MRNPYFIDTPTAISFSGGRTSGYMLHKILEAHDGKLPDYAKVLFANTGKEVEPTLDFVQEVSERWGVDIVWVERLVTAIPDESKKYGKTFSYETRVVDHATASRNGEPFRQLILARAYAPNPVARFCTAELKIRAMRQYIREHYGWEEPYDVMIGIRADEQSRAMKMHNTVEDSQTRVNPLWVDGVTRKDVYDFWNSQPFDLQLPNNNGVTDWGNCDLCFLKGPNKKLSLIRQKPELADWWIDMENELGEQVGKAAFFRNDQPSYATMKEMATNTDDMFAGVNDETIPCFCGD